MGIGERLRCGKAVAAFNPKEGQGALPPAPTLEAGLPDRLLSSVVTSLGKSFTVARLLKDQLVVYPYIISGMAKPVRQKAACAGFTTHAPLGAPFSITIRQAVGGTIRRQIDPTALISIGIF